MTAADADAVHAASTNVYKTVIAIADLSAGVRDLYADAYEAPGSATAKLADIQPLGRASQGVVNALGIAMQLEVFDAVAEAYNIGARAGLVELGAVNDADARRIADTTAVCARSSTRPAARGRHPEQHTTVGEWLELWLAGKKALRKSGKDRYEVDIRCHLLPRIGHIQLDRLTVAHRDTTFEGIAETASRLSTRICSAARRSTS